jgi:F420-0:gamma-glutamyl ligase
LIKLFDALIDVSIRCFPIVTLESFVDEIAGMADLLMGEAGEERPWL